MNEFTFYLPTPHPKVLRMHKAMLPGVATVKILENHLWIVVKVVGSNPAKNVTPEKVFFKYFAWNPEHLLAILYVNNCRKEEQC